MGDSVSTVSIKDDDKRLYLRGRRTLYTDYDVIDESNVVQAVQDVKSNFGLNSGQINYLWKYYKGEQPILHRQKEVRPEIVYNTVENHAQEICAFKIGYQLAEPLQYTSRMQDNAEDYETKLAYVNELNTLMFAEDKASCDRDLFEWLCICGVGYRMVIADTPDDVEDGGAPFEIYTLDPRHTAVIYSKAYHHKPVFAIYKTTNANKDVIYNVYTKDTMYTLVNDVLVSAESHTYGSIPIVEYKLNNARIGAFESVIPLLDALNVLESNRLEDIEQVVQSLTVFMDCNVSSEDFDNLRMRGALKLKTIDPQNRPDVKMLQSALDQSGTQTVKDDIYQAIINICGMPNRNGQSSSTSDTGAAVLLRDGWTLAESHAKSYELQFKRAERDFLRVVLAICRQSKDCDLDLRVRDIELAFNRRNYENIQVKSQVLTTMLSNNSIHPQLAFQSCGMFTDPDAAYKQSMEYKEENQARMLENMALQAAQSATDPNNGDDNQDETNSESDKNPPVAGSPQRKSGDGVS